MNPKIITAFLRRIPQSNQDALPIHEISDSANAELLYGYALMLKTIGLVQLDSAKYIKATSQTAKYSLESLASFVENDMHWIDDWKTRGIHRIEGDLLQNGATFLYELEKRRIELLDNPEPSRIEEVVQVLIKRSNPQTGEAEFLMQYDSNADQYQFIGGRRSPNDKDLEMAIIREIDEEIFNTLCFEKDYQLSLLLPDMVVEAILSPTFGALTEYHFTVYHMTHLNQNIKLQKYDAWVPVSSVLSGTVNANGRTVTTTDNSLYQQMNASIRGGLAQLPDSLSI